MRQRHFEIFHAVAATGSVVEAARRLNVSQPAVSKYLAELQDELGFELRTRRNGHYALTDEGRVLFEEIGKSLIAFEKVRQAALDIKTMRSGHLEVACLPMFANDPLPAILASFYRDHPQTGLTVTTLYSAGVIDRVITGKADVGIGLHAPAHPEITSTPIASFDLVAVFDRDDPFHRCDIIRPADLTGRDIVTVGTDDIVQSEIDAVLEEHGVRPSRRLKVLASDVVVNSVRAGLGVGLVDFFTANRILKSGGMNRRFLLRAFRPKISYIVSVITREASSPSSLAEAFVNTVISHSGIVSKPDW